LFLRSGDHGVVATGGEPFFTDKELTTEAQGNIEADWRASDFVIDQGGGRQVDLTGNFGVSVFERFACLSQPVANLQFPLR
jgi:hypothetical protein